MVGKKENLRVQRPQHRIAAEQAREHEDLGREEKPYSQLARVVLLLERLEVVRQVGGVLVMSGRYFCGFGHGVLSTEYRVLSSKI